MRTLAFIYRVVGTESTVRIKIETDVKDWETLNAIGESMGGKALKFSYYETPEET